MLQICITFDYELFFGKNYGTDKEILFEPTEKLITMLDEEGVSATFFADTCSVAQCQKYGRDEYVKGFTEQIQKMCQKNQDVQLHIHSHWMKSEYKEEEWVFDNENYRLQSFGFNTNTEENAYAIIRQGKYFLESTLQEIEPAYQCVAYRAGGFTLQPHQELVKALYEEGIRVDSSIAPMLSSEGVNSYDYRHEVQRVNWNISSEEEWWVDSSGKEVLYEIPIATENKNPFFFLIKRIFLPKSIKLNLEEMRGSYISIGQQSSPKRFSVLEYISCYNAMSTDAYQAEYLYKQLKRFYKKHNCTNSTCAIALIGHPKLVTDAYVENLRKLIHYIKADDKRMCIRSIAQVYSDMKKEI